VIRKATLADAQPLHDLAAVTFPLACPPGSTAESQDAFIREHLSVAAFTRYLGDADRELFVSTAGEAVGGYTMVVFGEPGDADAAASVTTRPTAELSKVYVLPELHGTGIAAALVGASVAAARARGARSVWLGVNQLNARANRFYEKCGFTRVGTKKFRVGDVVEDDYVLELQELDTVSTILPRV
jgi:ribosomal protein S18 acetylase RimI-like enzyme